MRKKLEENKFEKHYTSINIIEHMYELVDEYYGINNVTEFLENSAGSGNIVDVLKSKNNNINILAFDIFNETGREDIIQLDYLKHEIEYKKGRVCIMNPPFQKSIPFLTKSLKECDLVVSILPLSTLLNINYDLYDLQIIEIYRKMEFHNLKKDVMIIVLKNK